ncbi:MAG: hypothetical protein QM484_02405 [Woeseiaceae bacterium]
MFFNHRVDTSVILCETCHTPGNFATGTFDHLAPNKGSLVCSDCHNNINSVGKISNHLPTSLECDSCHTEDTSSTPSTFTGTLYHYNPISENFPNTGCSSCHDGVIQKGKYINHLSTVRDCSSCHTISNAAALTFTGGIYDHDVSEVSNNCASCHDGKTAIDKTNKGTKINHIPSQKECSECHIDTTVTGGFSNNQFLTNSHPSKLNGCAGCHTSKYLSAQPTLLKSGSVNHVPTAQDCHSCHSNSDFKDKTQFTHAGITANCESCHDGNYFTSANAMGKAQALNPHPVTAADCGLCHGIGNNFKDGIFDHTGIIDNCSSCHADNAPAPPTGAVTRKSGFPSHVVTTQDCSVCHIPGTFKTAVFNHNKINSGCVDCHLDPGATATVKPLSGHVTTTKDCFECHNTTGFAGAQYDHTDIVSNCATCHDGVIALGKDGNHACDSCHGNTVGPIPSYPSNFVKSLKSGETNPDPYCAACHENDFDSVDKHIGGKNGTVKQNQNCAASGCHDVGARAFN